MSGDGDHALADSSDADGNTVDLHLGPRARDITRRGGEQRDPAGQSLDVDVVDVEELSLEELDDPESDDELDESEDEDEEPERLSFL